MSTDSIKKLFEGPLFVCRGDITTQTYEDLFDWYRNLAGDNQKNCTIVIDSEGGEVVAGLDMYNVIRLSEIASGIKTKALVTRQACSAATMVLLGCSYRVGLKESRYLIHPVALHTTISIPFITRAIEPDEEFVDMLMSQLKGMANEQCSIARILKSRTTLSSEQINEASIKDVWLTAYQAEEIGMIHSCIEL